MLCSAKIKINDLKYAFHGWKKYRRDPLYKIDNLKRGIGDHREKGLFCDEKLVKRLADFYFAMNDAQKSVPAYYLSADDWQHRIDCHYKDLIGALKINDTVAAENFLNNFLRKHGLGFYWHEIPRLINNPSGRYMYMNAVFDTFYFWKYIMGSFVLPLVLSESLVGNPYGYYMGDIFLTTGSCFCHWLMSHLGGLINDIKRLVVMEIGGGYGQMASYLIKDKKDCVYINFDLPEVAVIQANYLMKVFPAKKVLLFDEAQLDREALNNYEIIIMPNFAIDTLPDKSADLVFNTTSLGEMRRDTVEKYIEDISRVCKGWFFHMNHEYYPNKGGIPASEYPLGEDKWLKVYKLPYIGPFNFSHNARGIRDDAFLYLYQRMVYEQG